MDRDEEICVCPNCYHEMADHGISNIEIGTVTVMVWICLGCPNDICMLIRTTEPTVYNPSEAVSS